MNYYHQSDGTRISKQQIDRNVNLAKKQKLRDQLNDHGWNFCEAYSEEHSPYLTCSHIISVNKCQQDGKSELAWDVKNIKILCITCHAKFDKNNVMNPKK